MISSKRQHRYVLYRLIGISFVSLGLPLAGCSENTATQFRADENAAFVDDGQALTSAEEADQALRVLGYPLAQDPQQRFALLDDSAGQMAPEADSIAFLSREDLATQGQLRSMQRVLRFAHITDLQLVDDDAPFPMRQGLLDEVYAATISSGGQRPQEEYADEIMQSLVQMVNAHHRLDAIEFAVHTGDNIDNGLENELMRYLDLLRGTHTLEGPVSGLSCTADGQSADVDDLFNDVLLQCTSLPQLVADYQAVHGGGFDPEIPQYVATGNHDLLVQGNVPIEPGFNILAETLGRHFLHIDEFVKLHFADGQPCNSSDPIAHGFAYVEQERRCDGDVENDSYYRFDRGGIRHIVLDTVNDDFFQTNEQLSGILPTESNIGHDLISGLSEGALDIPQWEWLQQEMDAAEREGLLVILYSHHTMNSFYNEYLDPLCGPPGCANDVLDALGFVGRERVRAQLDRYSNLLAWVGGHTHQHRVTAIDSEHSDGFWNIETAGLLDMPQESRLIEVWVDSEARKGFIALDPIGHIFEIARQVAESDPQHDAIAARGALEDRRVLLWFDLPQGLRIPQAD